MKNVIRGLSVLLFIGSIIAYFIFQEPIKSVTVEDYSILDNKEFTYHSSSDGEKLYLYAKNVDYDEVSFEGGIQISLESHENTLTNRFIIEPIDQFTVDTIKFHDYTDFYYPSFDGYKVIGEIEFDKGAYDFESFFQSGEYIISNHLPQESNIIYTEYSNMSLIFMIFSGSILALTFLKFDNGYHSEKYQQGYKKPQRGRKERY